MTAGFAEPPELTAAQRDRLLALVDQRFGIRGSDYGASRIDAAVQKVLPRSGCETVCDLLSALDDVQDPRWLYELVESLTVGETYFLRDGTQIAALRETVLPEAIGRRVQDKRLRVWSAGCSTGEEVYTLAILLKERNLPADWELTLLGTDVNRESLRVAREATYPAWSFRATPPAIRDRYFASDFGGGTWRVKEPLRRMARFAWSNLGADPMMAPLADIDLVVCRNVTIYFDDSATQRLYRALVRSLAPGGWLMLGSSDPIPADRELLERVEVADTVLWRRLSEPSPNRPKTPPRTVIPLGGKMRSPLGEPASPSAVDRIESAGATREQPTNDLEAGLLALESGSTGAAIESLRRATFRDASSALAQFALARAYVAIGDRGRALTALLHTRRLLAPLSSNEFVPGSDSLSAEALRQTVQTFLEDLTA